VGWKGYIRKSLEHVGLYVQRQSNNPRANLLGLRNLNIRSILDVGAHAGQFARFARKAFHGVTLYCFEPLPEPFAQLSAWAARYPDVHPINVALGDEAGTAAMFVHTEHSYSSSLLKSTQLSGELFPMTVAQAQTKITVKRLDDVAAVLTPALRGPTLIKLDVQGFEGKVIKGGRRTFANAQACILEVSLDALYEQQSSFKELFLALDELGFRYAGNLDQVYGKDGHVIYLDAVFCR
jgi:FkbM family methyltransferase